MEPSGQGVETRRQERTWPYLLALVLLPFLLFIDALSSPRTAIGGDSLSLYWPDLVYLYKSLVIGHFPLWDPYERAGDPFAFDPQSGLWYLGNAPFLLLAWLWGDLPHLFQEMKILVHLAIGSVGMFFFLQRSLKLDGRASFCGALIFLFQPYLVSHIRHILLLPVAFLPWMLFFLARLRHETSWLANLAWFSFFGSLTILSGSPPATWYVFLTAGLVGLWFMAQASDVVPRWRFLALGFFGAALSLLCGAATWFPAMFHVPLSVVQNRSFGYLSVLSLRISDLTNLMFAGHPNEETWVTFGFLPLVLALIAPFSRRFRWATLYLLGVASLFFLVLVGRELPLFQWLTSLPCFNLFRIPARYILVSGTVISILAAIGLMTLTSWLKTRRAFVLAVVGPWLLLLLSISVLITTLAPVMRQVALQELKRDPSSNPPGTERMEGLTDRWRMLDEGFLGNGPGDRFFWRDFRGYATNFVYFRWAEARKVLKKKTSLLSVWNVRYYGPHRRDFHATVPRIGKVKGWKALAPGLYENKNAWPSAFWTKDIDFLAKNAKGALSRLKTKGIRERALILERDTLSNDEAYRFRRSTKKRRNRSPKVDAEKITITPNETVVVIKAPSDGLLVLNECWYPGWTATVDGIETKVFPANYLQRAVEVPQGRHTVRFSFCPKPVYWGASLTLFGHVMLLLGFAWSRWGHRFRRKSSSSTGN